MQKHICRMWWECKLLHVALVRWSATRYKTLKSVALSGHSSSATTPLSISFKRNQCTIILLLTTMSWHPPPAVGSCRRGRRLPGADVARHRFAFSGQACCPWSAASPPHSRCWGKCSAVETWQEIKRRPAQSSRVLGGSGHNPCSTVSPTHECPEFLPQFFLCVYFLVVHLAFTLSPPFLPVL